MDELDGRSTGIEQWMQLSSLSLLVGIAEHGSLSAGARAVGMAQPNASRALKTLERRLGYRLVARASTGSKLTDEGALTVEWAREVLGSVARLWTGAQALAAPAEQEFSFAASMTIAEHLAPDWIGQLHGSTAQIKTRMKVMNSAQVIDAVQRREVPLGFVETPELPAGLDSATVFSDELVLIVPPAHSWAAASQPVSLEELARTPLVERESGSGTRAFLDAHVGVDRAAPLAEFNSASVICQSVASGMGPAVLSKLAVDSAVRRPALRQVPLQGGPLLRPLRAIWLLGEPLSAPARALLGLCRNQQR